MNQKQPKVNVLSVILTLILAASTIFFGWQVTLLNVLPGAYFWIFMGMMAIIDLLLILLLFKKRGISGIVLAALFSVLFLAGGTAAHSANSVLKQVSNVTVTVNAMGLYVKDDNAAETLADAKDYSIGILKALDRPNTDECLKVLEEELGASVQTTEYVSMFELAQAVREGKADAMLINGGYLSLLKDDNDLYYFMEHLRLIWSHDLIRELETPSEPEEDAEPRSTFVVYIGGNDTIGELEAAGRNDVNILMAVNPDKGEILLVNTPRDYFVELPISGGERDKLTHAGIYGVDVAMGTLADLYNIPIDHYLRMNFSGFVNIIDALGGVTVENDTEFSGRGEYYPEGTLDLNGYRALIFARERYAFEAGDRKRGQNHQELIKGVIKKVASPTILSSYSDIIKAVGGCFQTSMTQEEIAALVQRQLEEGTEWNITSISVDGSDDVGSSFSMPNSHVYRMIPDMDSVEEASVKLREVLELPLPGDDEDE